MTVLIAQGQAIFKAKPVLHSNTIETLSPYDTLIEDKRNIIEFEKGTSNLKQNSLNKLNRLLFTYTEYSFKIIGYSTEIVNLFENRWKMIRDHIIKSAFVV